MTINEKSAYIKGLIEGLGLTNETKEGKVILELASLISEMCAEISDLQEENKELRDWAKSRYKGKFRTFCAQTLDVQVKKKGFSFPFALQKQDENL